MTALRDEQPGLYSQYWRALGASTNTYSQRLQVTADGSVLRVSLQSPSTYEADVCELAPASFFEQCLSELPEEEITGFLHQEVSL